MRAFLHLFLVVLLLLTNFLSGQNTTRESKSLLKNILGAWTCFEITRNYSQIDKTERVYFHPALETEIVNQHWLFTSDSIFEFEYPCLLINRSDYQLLHDSISFGGITSYGQVKINNDTMILLSKGSSVTPVLTNKFVKRADLDMKIVSILKEKIVNHKCYQGELKLQKKERLNNGVYKSLPPLPVKMPLTIFINDDLQSQIIWETGKVEITIEGEKREFIIAAAEWYSAKKNNKNKLLWEQKTSLLLTPGKWWKGKPFSVLYKE